MIYDPRISMGSFGSIVSKHRFLGRQNEIDAIRQRIIEYIDRPANLALIGLPHIGKSSLVQQELLARKEELFARDTPLLLIRIPMARYYLVEEFFQALVTTCRDELLERGSLTTNMKHAATHVMENSDRLSQNRIYIERFFKQIQETNIAVVFILENFDYAEILFNNDIANFDWLRELTTQPDYNVTLITLSQTPLREIGPQAQLRTLSKFDQTFDIRYVEMFDKQGMSMYFERLTSFGVTVTEELKERIEVVCGRHPYLLEMLGAALERLAREQPGQEPNIDVAYRMIEQPLSNYCDGLIEFLRGRDTLYSLRRLLTGSANDVPYNDLQLFIKYGLIKRAPASNGHGEEWIAFCEHLQMDVLVAELNRHKWPLWVQTENTLRNAVASVLRQVYGNDWCAKLAKERRDFLVKHNRNLFERCIYFEQSERKKPSHNLLKHTTTEELRILIFVEWKHIAPLLGEDEYYWQDCLDHLIWVRGYDAHSNSGDVYIKDRDKAEQTCKKILALLDVYRPL